MEPGLVYPKQEADGKAAPDTQEAPKLQKPLKAMTSLNENDLQQNYTLAAKGP